MYRAMTYAPSGDRPGLGPERSLGAAGYGAGAHGRRKQSTGGTAVERQRAGMSGTVRPVLSITTGLGWEQVAPELAIVGDVTDKHKEQAMDLGATIAARLMN